MGAFRREQPELIGSPAPAPQPRSPRWRRIAVIVGMTAVLGGGAIVGSTCACLAPGPQDPAPAAPGAGQLANLFAVPEDSADGTTTCAPSATQITYEDALVANAVCAYDRANSYTSWDKACEAAVQGNDVGIMPGEYTAVDAGGFFMGGPTLGQDCAPGALDYNPNWREQELSDPSAVLEDWVNFKPGVDCNGDPNISARVNPDSPPYGSYTFANGNWHLIVGSRPGSITPGGECFNLNRTLYIFDRNDELPRASNLIFRGQNDSDRRMQMYGLEMRGPLNVWLDNVDYGPNVQCAADDANASPEFFKCDPDGPYFESIYATWGSNTAGCIPNDTDLCAGWFIDGANEQVEPYIHPGSWAGVGETGYYNNVRISNFHQHDGQAKGTGGGVHPGCIMFDGNAGTPGLPSHNLVLDNYSCERQVIGVQHADSGVTVQNSYFACPVTDLPNSTGDASWDECGAFTNVGVGCRGDASYTPGCTTSNVLYRYNVFLPMDGAASGFAALCFQCVAPGDEINYSNVRVVGNIFIGGNLQGCGETGVTCENNAVLDASATDATDTTTLSCDPVVDSDATTPDSLWREETQIDVQLNGSSCGVPVLDPSTLGSDYQLDFDADGDARGASSTHAGADN